MQLGLIGVGKMGHGIGKNLLGAGHGLAVVAHQSRSRVDDLVRCGATEVQNARALALSSEAVLVCVTGSREFESIAEGPDGLLAGLTKGQAVIDCTTGDPDVVSAYCEKIEGLGGQFADCPLARTPVEAEAGTLNTMVGAKPELFQSIRPILGCFCENIFHVGPPGSGTRMKLINNLITMGQAALVGEAFAACRATGVDVNVFYDIISKGGGNSGIFQMIMPDILERGAFEGMKFSIANAAKDLGYFNSMTANVGLAAPMGHAVHDRLVTAGHLGFKDGFVGHLVAAALALNELEPGKQTSEKDK